MRSVTPIVIGCVLGTVALTAGCTDRSADAGPRTPTNAITPSPSPTIPITIIEAEAIAAYEDYIAMYDETARAGGYDIVADGEQARPDSVLKTTMGEERRYIDGSNQRLKRNKEQQVAGTRKVVRVEVTESVPLPEQQDKRRVGLYTCVDQTSVKIKGPKGTRSPDPYLEEWPIMVYNVDEPTGWKVSKLTGQKVKSC